MDKILDDGSVEGKTFSGPAYKGTYPSPKMTETYGEYNERVKKLKAEGFHLGDLSWDDWDIYCKGSGQYDGFDSNTKIGEHYV